MEINFIQDDRICESFQNSFMSTKRLRQAIYSTSTSLSGVFGKF